MKYHCHKLFWHFVIKDAGDGSIWALLLIKLIGAEVLPGEQLPNCCHSAGD